MLTERIEVEPYSTYMNKSRPKSQRYINDGIGSSVKEKHKRLNNDMYQRKEQEIVE